MNVLTIWQNDQVILVINWKLYYNNIYYLYMIINTIKLDDNHWSTNWIPISYKLNKIQKNKSVTFLWADNYQVNALARAYFISDSRIEIGDVWLHKKFRGKLNNDKIKFSFATSNNSWDFKRE